MKTLLILFASARAARTSISEAGRGASVTTAKKALIAALTLASLAGCAGNLRLLEDGKSHAGSWNNITKTLEATIDGKKYTGSFSQNATVGFGSGFATASSGTNTAFASGSGTTVASNGSGQGYMTSEDGKVIQCVFQAAFGRGQGECQGMDGRRFVLIIGG